MSDIYKNKERMPVAETKPKRRRRSSPLRAFDDQGERRRRSKNAGGRRLLHLSRKGENEKVFWWGLLIAIVVVLGLISIWQFGIREHVLRQQSDQENSERYQRSDAE